MAANTRTPLRRRLHATSWMYTVACAAVLLHRAPAAAEDWPQFRGPNCSGVSTASRALPVEFSDTKNVAWSVKLGDGIGSPVVAAGRVFVDAMIGPETVGLYCFNASSGKEIWHRALATGPLAEIHQTNSNASTTPAADADRVYFYFSTLGLMAFDAGTGRDVWHLPLPVPYFVFKWGPGMSPVLFDDKVLFCQDDDLYPAFYAVDKRTGNVLWKDDRNDMAVNYSHPIICETAGGPEIVLAGTGKLIGYDPKTGKRKWFARTLLRNIKTTPVTSDGVIYLSLESSGIANQWLASVDQAETGNHDGKLTKAEIQAFVGDVPIPEAFFKKTFDRGDLNKDGILEGEELDLAFLPGDNFAGARFDSANPSGRLIQAVRGGGTGDVTATHVLWNFADRTPDHIVSPLVVGNRMFVMKCGGITSCFNTADGEPFWHLQRAPNPSDYFASPVYGDGKLYLAGANGVVVVLKSGEKLEPLAANDMGDSLLATPAIADGRLFLRTRSRLFAVAQK